MERLCTICARGGSQGLKNKNLRLLGGEPLIVHTIIQAKACGLFSAVAVSSDSDEILSVSRKAGATHVVKRPPELATSEVSKIPAIQHCLGFMEHEMQTRFDIVVDLQPTSPLRYPSDIEEAVQIFESKNVSNLISGTQAHSSPYVEIVELDDRGVARPSKPLPKPIFRRQDSPKCFTLNGSIYVWRREALLNAKETVFLDDTMLYLMPTERSIDIDTQLDFDIAEFLNAKLGILEKGSLHA